MADMLISRISGLFALGGPVVIVLVALSVIALTLVLVKLAQFMGRRVGRHGAARRALALWREGRTREALETCARQPTPATRTLMAGMAMHMDSHADPARLESELGRVAGEELHELQKGFRALDAIAQIAPLLGLFGTVLGMIEAFRAMQGAGTAVDPSVLAGGIWVALMTTAVGLAVAMPVSMLLAALETRVDNERAAIESIATQWLNARSDREPDRQPSPRTRHPEAPAHGPGLVHAH
ncbi:MotA/TolQ/ExbB proton channel family protein [Pelagibacterium montanilacus]|uniref:MotA/TolQ/ExbB proton channel family protein n=1 Tax=Pelagibacterium montanilacus TaxID=2185280 RepID=UPI000F8F36F6|nr:MotA/TolQ/ExbB proton channel family protein [Pelagibacterium montanilacus]